LSRPLYWSLLSACGLLSALYCGPAWQVVDAAGVPQGSQAGSAPFTGSALAGELPLSPLAEVTEEPVAQAGRYP